MSTWIYIEPPDGPRECWYSTNVTWNLSPMWAEAGIFEALKKSHGRRAKEIIDPLVSGLAFMRANPERFTKLEAPNGWGTYEQAISFLDRYIRALQAHPDGVIRIS